MEVITDASLNFETLELLFSLLVNNKVETLELLFSLLVNNKVCRENKDSSGRSGVPCLHSKDSSCLAVIEFFHPLSCMLP